MTDSRREYKLKTKPNLTMRWSVDTEPLFMLHANAVTGEKISTLPGRFTIMAKVSYKKKYWITRYIWERRDSSMTTVG